MDFSWARASLSCLVQLYSRIHHDGKRRDFQIQDAFCLMVGIGCTKALQETYPGPISYHHITLGNISFFWEYCKLFSMIPDPHSSLFDGIDRIEVAGLLGSVLYFCELEAGLDR